MNDFYVNESVIQGYGCFANRKIKNGEHVWFPILVMESSEGLKHYRFPFDRNRCYIVLSEFSYCNHSIDPNFEMHSLNKISLQVGFTCIKDVDIHDEITICYRLDTNFDKD